MDDYSALAQRISVSVPEVRGCLILSRDGMVLGAYPEDDESLAKGAWLRFVTLGEPERSFIEYADQTWAYVRRGPYAAFAVAGAGVRPGVMVDHLEQALLTAEEGRTRRDTLRLPDAANAPSGKPRTSLHPGGGKEGKEGKDAKEGKGKDRDKGKPVEAVAESIARQEGWSRGSSPEVPADGSVAASTASADGPTPVPPAPGPDGATPTALRREPQRLVGADQSGGDDESEVDRVLLAKEFSGLLQLDSGDDERSS